MSEQVWFKPSQIVREKLILDMNGKPNYRYVIRLITSGALKANVWTHQGKNTEGAYQKAYYVVHIDEIRRFNNS